MTTRRWGAWGVTVGAVACARVSTSAPRADAGATTLDASNDNTQGDSAQGDGAQGDGAQGDSVAEGDRCLNVRVLAAGVTFLEEGMPPTTGRTVAQCDGAGSVTHELVLRATIPPGERVSVAAERPAIDSRNIRVEITADCLGTRCVEGGEPPPSDSTPRRARYINTSERAQTVFVRLGSRVTEGPAWARAMIHIGAAQDNSTCERATPLVVDGPPLAQWPPDFPTSIRWCGTASLPQAYYRVTAAPGETIAVRVDGQPGGADFHVLHGCGLRCSELMAGISGQSYVFTNSTDGPEERIIVVTRQTYSRTPYLLTAQRVTLDRHASCERPFALSLEQGYTLDPSREGLTLPSESCYRATPYVYFRVDMPARSTRWLVVRADAALQGLSSVYGARKQWCLDPTCGGPILGAGRSVGSIPIENLSDAPATQLVALGRVGITTPLAVSLSPTAP